MTKTDLSQKRDFREEKRVLRKRVLARRGLLSQEERGRQENALFEKLSAHPFFQEAEIVLGFAGYGSEVDTDRILREAILSGKQLFLPKVEGEEIVFYRVEDLQNLAIGYRGIREPVGDSARFLGGQAENGRVVILMPGVAFDIKGNRMGYGKGFYDRFLTSHPDLISRTVGIGYDCQLVEEVPCEEQDIQLCQVICAKETIVNSSPLFGYDITDKEIEMTDLYDMGQRAACAKYELQKLSTSKKNQVLIKAAELLLDKTDLLLQANEEDIRVGEESGMHPGLLDRLRLTKDRVQAMAEGLRQIAELPDCIGETMERFERPNGLRIEKRRVPIGVIGIIYESRPNVTADAFGLCFKTGNAVILKGGKDAIHSNIAITAVLREALRECGVTEDAVSLIENTERSVTAAFMKLNQYVDVLIPRGGAGLIQNVVENSTIPVIETGTGNCHIYVDKSADYSMAAEIIFNAKTQRIGVCNACESLVIHEEIKDDFLPILAEKLRAKNVEMRGDAAVCEVLADCIPATEEDYGREYLDYIISLKTVKSVEEAIEHINKYNTKHSECIVTEDVTAAERFLNEVDAACVYVNASTRFTDGFEFGFGAEIGISTQKLHARGPMGLRELTSYKYVVRGNGQVRG